jgi:hypothetical protein
MSKGLGLLGCAALLAACSETEGQSPVPPDGEGGQGGGGGSGGAGVVCGDGAAGLLFDVVARNAAGTCTQCPIGEDLAVVARITNPCDEEAMLTTAASCLVSYWQVKNVDVDVEGGAAECAPPATTWAIPPHSSVEQGDSLSNLMWGHVYPGHHEVMVVFYDPQGTSAQTSFDVVE